jgi:hypothetical protein
VTWAALNRKLWADVAVLLKKAETPSSKENKP